MKKHIEVFDDESADIAAMSHIFNAYIDENISDEQVARVTNPVKQQIAEGKFDKNKQQGFVRIHKPLVSMVAAAAVVGAFLFVNGFQSVASPELVEIPDMQIPLAAYAYSSDNAYRITIDLDFEYYEVTAVGASLTFVLEAANENTYIVRDMPDGAFRIAVKTAEAGLTVYVADLVIVDGVPELTMTD